MGLACYKSLREEDARLSRCSGCHRMSYCSPGLQGFATLFFSLPNDPTTDLNVLHNTTEAYGSNILSFCERSLQRQATMPERNLVGWEP
ncbi:hypothetical protein B0H14DRAFT_3036569, partial [Mycena olivaceomarginata]